MCINKNGVHLADSYCKGRKPRNSKTCKQGRCPHWQTSDWGKCSTSCGQGVRSRNVFCEASNKQIVNKTLCSHLSKPDNLTSCQVRKCGRFYWKHSRWSKCSVTCGQGVRTRNVGCALMASKRLVHPRYCPKAYKPRHRKRCMFAPCAQVWVASDWQQCSQHCGEGRQSRKVTCQQLSKEGWLLPLQVTGCNQTVKPIAEQLCNIGECGAVHRWHVTSWSVCSKTCGFGRQTRQVLCVDRNGQKKANIKCLRHFKPEFSKSCYQGPCYASSCKELKKISAIVTDDDYHLLIEGQIRLIYCHKMASTHPHEYLTLPTSQDENFSEVFDKRLRKPNRCPNKDQNVIGCEDCYRNKTYNRAGHTGYMKVRINITSLAVIVRDYEFSQSDGRRRIPFATAGDCYSNTQQCPQGSFQVNLTGTGFRVKMDNSWYNKGYKTVSRISISKAGQLVRGLCGGHCGMCSPDGTTGLLLEVQP
ncbi:hypothetical protein LSH36_660g05029 [Paralvinella palmiformis]|uniref:GON domain-containing protein n=1 Tax=Paralvinella palmiformis TaxID=53620 RepID=A0AAD9MWM9_9ANNE|nr:hypothetical protein LSH36_660g05029 [Paralvinella palmiformis]